MKVEFLEKFSDDLNKIDHVKVQSAILKIIKQIEKVESPRAISNMKKLTGHTAAFRIRLGSYRIGIFIDGNTVQFARILHRKDIYKLFP